jgi:hypothetical protein
MIDRRRFLAASFALLSWPLLRTRRANAAELASSTRTALASSPLVYVSPLRSDGSESRCHGEVWFAWLDGAVVLNTAADRWKSRSLRRGLDRARIWVGDFGRVKGLLGANEAFRKGPVFDARAEFVTDPAVLDRLLDQYEAKYPEEIAQWRGPMRTGFEDGSRVLIRYRPL